MADKVKPGERVPRSGQYEELGPRGGHTGHEVQLDRGTIAPPTHGPGGRFLLVDPVRNDRGKP